MGAHGCNFMVSHNFILHTQTWLSTAGPDADNLLAFAGLNEITAAHWAGT